MSDTPPILYTHPLRIYWEDTDAGGVVFYANYLKFFERARTEWLRSFGHAQETLRTATTGGAMFIVVETQVRYLKPARLDDLLHVTVQVKWSGQASMTITQAAWRGDDKLAEGEIRIGCVDPGTFKPRRIPNELLNAIA